MAAPDETPTPHAERPARLLRATPAALIAMVAAGAGIVAALGVPAAPASAAAPFPDLGRCLGQGSFNLADDACSSVRPVRGDGFGRIDGVQRVTVEPGHAVRLTFAAGAGLDFEAPQGPCGDLGCPRNAIVWRTGTGGVSFGDGCGSRDATCTVHLEPGVGDQGETVGVVFAQRYVGIRPTDGVAYALYAAPRLYPVRVDPIDRRGRALSVEPGDVAFAVRDGSSALQADCAPTDWWIAASRQAAPTIPDCVTLVAEGLGTAGAFAGVLPIDTRWTVTALPSGELLQPIGARPTPFRRVGVAVGIDDVWTTIVREARPVLEVALVVDAPTMALGTTQTARLTIRATDGDAGTLTSITFDVPGVLDAVADPDAALAIGPLTNALDDPLQLGAGASRTIEIPVTAVGLGTTSLRVTATAVDDVGGLSIDGVSMPMTVVLGATVATDQPVPVVVRAHDVTASFDDSIEGTLAGAPGTRATVSLAMLKRTPDGTCAGDLSDPSAQTLGSVAVDIGPDGTGTFSLVRRLAPGHAVLGVATVDGAVSPSGACTPVSVDSPGVTVEPVEVTDLPERGDPFPQPVAIRLSDAAEVPVTVTVATADGSATAPEDYRTLGPTTVEIPPGVLSAAVTVEVMPDPRRAEDETFSVELSDVVGGSLDADRNAATVTIPGGTGDAGMFTMAGRWHLSHRLEGRWVDQSTPMVIERANARTGRFSGSVRGPAGVLDVTGTVKGDRMTTTITWRAGEAHPGVYTCRLKRDADPVTATCDYRSGSYRTKARWVQEAVGGS